MRRWLAGSVACGLLVFVAVAGAQAAPETARHSTPREAARRERIAVQLDAVLHAVNALQIPGYVVGITGAGVGRFVRAAGSAAPGQPMTPDDHFRIGSITKTFTATVILELVDRGLLRLDDPISKWEPLVPNASRITIHMLLNMTSGIWDEGGTGPGGQASSLSQWIGTHCAPPATDCGQYWSPQQIVELAIHDTEKYGPASPPGVYYYSDTNYVILGIIAQMVTHEPLEALMRRLVLGPLGLHETSFPTRGHALPAPAATGYLPVVNASQVLRGYAPGPLVSPSALFGAGNAVSTLHDVEVWARALASGTLLSRRMQRLRLELLQTGGGFSPLANTTVHAGLAIGYGLGIAGIGGMLGHNGVFSPPGFTSEMWELPRRQGSIVILLNSITICSVPGGAELLADALNATLSQIAFAPFLSTVPTTTSATCPVPTGAAPAG